MSIGWIKLHRGLTEWEWYDDINTSRLFIHCLLKANHKDKKWRGLDIKRGSFWTSLDTLSEETGLSKKCVRTSLDRLKATCELADKGHSTGRLRGRMVTVCKYDSYQGEGTQTAPEGADKGQTKGTQRAATKNVKNVENEKNVNKLIVPVGINSAAWTEWVDYRKTKKKTVSQAAATKQFKLLSTYSLADQQKIIDNSISNDYQGLFELKGKTAVASTRKSDLTEWANNGQPSYTHGETFNHE
ncbi:hypothetical protein N9878_01670 [bacterium]|nr:hypothetical protein [bacterium]